MPHQRTSDVKPVPAEVTPPPFDGVGMPSRRFLHVALALMLALPAVVWLVRSPSAGDGDVGEGDLIGAVEIDEAAPDFTLDLFDGDSFNLTDHLARDGRPVVMNFWASWCVPCRKEMPAFDAVARRHPEVLVLGVAVQDTETEARAFAEEVDVSYPLGLDANGLVVERYPTLGLPTTWFITSDGIIAARWIGQLDQALLEDLIDRHLTG